MNLHVQVSEERDTKPLWSAGSRRSPTRCRVTAAGTLIRHFKEARFHKLELCLQRFLMGRTGVKGVGVWQQDQCSRGWWTLCLAFPQPTSAHQNKRQCVKLQGCTCGDPAGRSSDMILDVTSATTLVCRGTPSTQHTLTRIPCDGSRKAVLQLQLHTLRSPS